MVKTVLVTGSAGMIGSRLTEALLAEGYRVIGVDKNSISFKGSYEHFQIDLGDFDSFCSLLNEKEVDRVIHLAALAHTPKGGKYTKKMFEYFNVECSRNVFKASEKFNVPVLFISTVDVYGFQKGIVNPLTICKPVTMYGKTKFLAEQALTQSGCSYTIFRLSPVYTETIKRDIQKRYYLAYPKWAYQIGKNAFYEVLNVNKAVKEMVGWCKETPNKSVRILKDDALLETRECIEKEKEEGRANHIIHIPRWLALFGYYCLRLTGKNRFTYLLNKALFPLRSVEKEL